MPTVNAATRTQIWRVIRIVGTGLMAQPAVSSLVSSTLVRYPLAIAIVAAVEVIYHELTAPVTVIVPRAPAAPATPPPSRPPA